MRGVRRSAQHRQRLHRVHERHVEQEVSRFNLHPSSLFRLLEKCEKNLKDLSEHVRKLKAVNKERLDEEYDRMVNNLRKVQQDRAMENAWANPVLPDAILDEAIPGTIRTADSFLNFLRRLMEYLK